MSQTHEPCPEGAGRNERQNPCLQAKLFAGKSHQKSNSLTGEGKFCKGLALWGWELTNVKWVLKKSADEPKREYTAAEYFVLSMHPFPFPQRCGESQAGQQF